MSNAPSPSQTELSTWQEIARYLGVSVSQAQKWAKQAGMPVHRSPGGPKARVLAYRDELDAWKRAAIKPRQPIADSDTTPGLTVTHAPATQNRPFPRRVVVALTLVTVAAIATYLAWPHARQPTKAEVSGNTLVVSDAVGKVLWTHEFSVNLSQHGTRSAFPGRIAQLVDLDGDGQREVIFAASQAGPPTDSDELYCFSATGKVRWRYKVTLSIQMGGETFAGPWNITDVLARTNGRLWVTVAHDRWRPGALLELSANGEAKTKFLNAGHLYAVNTISRGDQSFVIVGGINNEYNTAIAAIIGDDDPPSCSPQTQGTRYACGGAFGSATPEYYFRFPPTDVSLETGDPYNRVRSIEIPGNEMTIRTTEERNGESTGIYSLSPQFQIANVAFDDSWAMAHRRLEATGAIRHHLGDCPWLNVSLPIVSWSRLQGWQVVRVPLKAGVGPDAYVPTRPVR